MPRMNSKNNTTEELDEDDAYYCWAPLTVEDAFRISEDRRWLELMRAGSVVSEKEFEDRIATCQQRYDEVKAHQFLASAGEQDQEYYDLQGEGDAAAQALYVLQRMKQFPPRKPFIVAVAPPTPTNNNQL